MATSTFVIYIILMFAGIVFYVRAFAWLMLKGSAAAQTIIAIASIVFCLVMAKCNIGYDKFYAIMFCLAIPFYLWLAIRAFNKLVPTKGNDNE